MENTYSEIIIHVVIAVKYKFGKINKKWKEGLIKTIKKVIKKNKHQPIAIDGMADHIHILIEIKPSQSLSDIIDDIKESSAHWINNNNLVKGTFEWQEGFGAFSHHTSQINKVVNYIKNQELQHTKNPFRDEYVSFLDVFDMEYDQKYIFKELI
ncbi:IS200/IS605 family transposase [Yeosuana sp. AK3]